MASSTFLRLIAPGTGAPQVMHASPTFEEIYDASAVFVFRAVSQLGVAPGAVEDVVQDVFLVVHRRLCDFGGRSSLRTWVYGIVIRVVRNHRRTVQRRRLDASAQASPTETELVAVPADKTPDALLARAQAKALLDRLLEELPDSLREVFVLSEIEEMSAPEIAEILETNPSTVYSRIRAARRAFEEGIARLRARDEWRLR